MVVAVVITSPRGVFITLHCSMFNRDRSHGNITYDGDSMVK